MWNWTRYIVYLGSCIKHDLHHNPQLLRSNAGNFLKPQSFLVPDILISQIETFQKTIVSFDF